VSRVQVGQSLGRLSIADTRSVVPFILSSGLELDTVSETVQGTKTCSASPNGYSERGSSNIDPPGGTIDTLWLPGSAVTTGYPAHRKISGVSAYARKGNGPMAAAAATGARGPPIDWGEATATQSPSLDDDDDDDDDDDAALMMMMAKRAHSGSGCIASQQDHG